MKTIEGYSLSNHQKRIWKLQEFNEDTLINHLSIRIEGSISIPKFAESLTKCIEEHEALRTCLQEMEAREYPLQVIKEQGLFSFSSPSSLNGGSLSDDLSEHTAIDKLKSKNGPTVHFEIKNIQQEVYELAAYGLSIFIDIRSLASIIQQAFRLYEDDKYTASHESIQYIDYSEWQNELFQDEEFKIEMPPIQSVLPYEKRNEQSNRVYSEQIRQRLEETLASRIKYLGKRYNLKPSSLILSSWKVLLSRLSCSNLPIGIISDGREYEELKQSIGQFEKVLPLQIDYSGFTYIEYAEEWKKQVDNYIDKAEYVNPLKFLDTPKQMVPYQVRYAEMESWSDIFNVSLIDWQSHSENHKLLLTLMPDDTSFNLILQYNGFCYSQEDVNKLIKQFVQFLDVCVSAPEEKLEHLPIFTRDDERQIQDCLNSSYFENSKKNKGTILQILEESARHYSNEPALIDNSKTLTYKELFSKSNRLAQNIKQFIDLEDRVAVCLPRSADAVISILAILKAGGCFVPIDVKWPINRIKYAIKNSGAKLVITNQAGFSDEDVKVLNTEEENFNIQQDDDTPLMSPVLPGQLAYILFTSGSTGVPKGVAVQHDSLLNYLLWIDEEFFGEDLKMPFISELGFDAFLKQMFYPLMRGKCVTLYSEEEVLEPTSFLSKFIDYDLNTLNIVPSLWNTLIEELQKNDQIADTLRKRLTHLMVGGEKISNALLKATWESFPNLKVINLYGPTETTSNATYSYIKNELFVPIGKPVKNTKVLVLNQNMERTAIGESGELYVGGAGLAREYFKNKRLTAEQFVPDPFESGQRLYKTGDTVRLMANGELEYIRRNDEQIKINGKRIELNEVEEVLLSHPGVKEAVVIPHIIEDKTLLAFYTGGVGEGEIREFLRKWLPIYMVPSKIILLSEMPLNSNGKTDRKLLQAFYEKAENARYAAPRTEIEKVISGIWESVLKRNQVGINDNFFELGGHSLNATQIISRLRKIYELEIPVSILFETETVEKLSIGINNMYPNEAAYIRAVSAAYLKAKLMAIEEEEKN
ncbi:amino acid adenylation domain-containing protein [Bacillus infantis]|uniref:Amino acid adenylation domain-containing protein n=1 Tax=Bacillus infantis TaxID=324767 RepID=A0A5D4RJM1_9BACI|nr:amino acid adenylation domain-containing protein [Bacillus infantis]TYS51130.1 amino acid adenylation domain-containing protein [Bacillus infantis]